MRIGVDEAGKGPVLGSMFAAAVRADPTDLPADVDDSKTIQPDRRTTLAPQIRSAADAVAVAEVPVERIDEPATDMNELTVTAHAEALGSVALDGLSVLLDAGEIDADRFGRRVANTIEESVSIQAVHRADETDPLVGAASILAKAAREDHVARLSAKYGKIGSGYPSDPTTREFLAGYVDSHGRLPKCARRSWQTSADALAAAEQASLAAFRNGVSHR